MQFNPHRPELLATAGAKGELFVTDLNDPENATRIGGSAAQAADFDTIDWNKKVPHILVTGSSGGFVTVWDVKAKKESLTLNNYGRKPVSAIAWNPDVPTKLAAATPSDQDPLILMWDLRNSSQPERILKGHDQGVLSLSWCALDNDLLLSSGKDNRNICWNPHTAQVLGEFPIVLNAAFQTRWCPRQPSLLATASFDNKIKIETIQNANAKATADVSGNVQQSVDADDFFATAQTQPQVSSFSLPSPPKWLQRPVGVAFGFGGRIAAFNTPGSQKTSKVKLETFITDSSVESSIEQFRDALESEDVAKMCDSRVDATSDEATKEDWRAIKTLLSEKPRTQILQHLGFDTSSADSTKPTVNGDATAVFGDESIDGDDEKNKRLSGFFGGDNTNFLTDLASSKGVKTNNPFHIFSGKESDADKQITRFLMLGAFEDALDVCLKEDRLPDAFMIASCGGQRCIDKAQAAYFGKQDDRPNYVRLLASVVGKNLWDVVHNADLQNWKETMAILCTYADTEEFPDLCEALGDRLEESSDSRKNASFCYLAGSKLDKVVPIWAKEMQETEEKRTKDAGDESAFSIHVQALQGFIEKVSIFRRAANYEDRAEQNDDSAYKLETLYSKYAEYADVVAAHGHLGLAEEYISLLPDSYPTADTAKSRIRQALKKPVVGARTSSRPLPATSMMPATTTTTAPSPTANRGAAHNSYMPSNAYGPSATAPGPSSYGPSQPTNSYAPSGPYAPSGAYQPSGPSFSSGPQPGAAQPPSAPPPPRTGSAISGAGGGSWNDLPEGLVSKPRSGRGTPAPAAVASPFPNQPNNAYAPVGTTSPPGPPGPPSKSSAPLPPPPRMGEGPPRMSSPPSAPPSNSLQPPGRPPSSVANNYAPAPSSTSANPQPGIPQRSASPYQPPPGGAAPSSRYAPAAAPQGAPNTAAPPPMGRPPVAPNPYSNATPYAPSQPPSASAPTPSGPPPMGPPPGGPPRGPPSRPPTGPPPMGGPRPGSATSQGSRSSGARHPPGDRSHISPDARPVFDIMHPEMQRIKSKAPANFKTKVDDTEKRLNILFDGLNNESIPATAIAQLKDLANLIQSRNFEQADVIQNELEKLSEDNKPWLVSLHACLR